MEQVFNYGSYSGFKQTVSELTENLAQLKEYCEDIGLEHTAKSIGETIEKTAKEHFEVAIVGEARVHLSMRCLVRRFSLPMFFLQLLRLT